MQGDRALDCLRAWQEEKGPVDAELDEYVALESRMIDLMQKGVSDSKPYFAFRRLFHFPDMA